MHRCVFLPAASRPVARYSAQPHVLIRAKGAEEPMLKYESIAADLSRSIEDGTLKPNDKLPTVVELCDLYGVSKITVKRAFDLLTEKGLISSRRGSGTFVKNTTELFEQTGIEPTKGAPGEKDSFSFSQSDKAAGFTKEHEGDDRTVTSIVYDFSIVNPPENVARHLNIHPEDFAYYHCRVRCLDDDPMVIEYTYMPIDLIPGLKISSFHRILRAVPATEEEAERLHTKPGVPMLEIEQIGFLDDGTPFEYSISRYEGSRGQLRDINVI